MAFIAADLKQISRAKGLRVTGVKEGLASRLIAQGNVPTGRQTGESEQLLARTTTRGALTNIALSDPTTPGAAQKWIETARSKRLGPMASAGSAAGAKRRSGEAPQTPRELRCRMRRASGEPRSKPGQVRKGADSPAPKAVTTDEAFGNARSA